MAQETDFEKIARLEREIERLRAENERLRQALEKSLRAAKRQAAPFCGGVSKRPPKPARKAGQEYGRAYRREVPEVVDAVVEVVHQAGLARKAVRLVPFGVLKG